MLNSGVYKIENLVTGKIYIGESSKISQRINGHFASMRKGKGFTPNGILEDVKVYGMKAFSIEVIHYTEINKCRNLETFYIDLYDSANPEKGYNKGVYRNRTERVVKEYIPSYKIPDLPDPEENYIKAESAYLMFSIEKSDLENLKELGMPYIKFIRGGRYQVKVLREWIGKHHATV